MTQTQGQARSLLLDLLSPARPVSQSVIDAAGSDVWEVVDALARRHRLLPMLAWLLRHKHSHLRVAENISAPWQEAARRYAMRALMAQQTLLQIHKLLEEAGIPYRALKGAYLAFNVYPTPGLRPLRDIDILVPADRVVDAYAVLQAHGALPATRHGVAPEAVLAHGLKHLPPIYLPKLAVPIELHCRLFTNHGSSHRIDLADDPGFWQRSTEVQVQGERLRYAAPEDLLLHLIVHAAYDHQFDNGPLTLSDLAFLIETCSLDWPLFWRSAERMGHLRGAVLVLRMVEKSWGTRGIDYAPAAAAIDVPADVVEASIQLLLRDPAERSNDGVEMGLRERESFGGKVAFLIGRMFPSRKEMAARAPIEHSSSKLVYYHVARWSELIAKRGRRLFKVLFGSGGNDNIGDLVRLNAFLFEKST